MLTQPLIEKLLSDATTKIALDLRRCLRSRFNRNTCTKCLEACQSGALELQGRQVVFDAEKCTSCMQCTAVCPSDAFTGSIDFLPLLHVLAEKETALLSCEKGIGNYNHITMPCIGILAEPILAAMNSVTRGNGFIDVSRCAACVNGHCLKILHENMQTVINRTGEDGKIRLRYLFDKQLDLPSDEKGQRRSFLQLVKRTIADIGREAVSSQLSAQTETKDPHSKNPARNATVLQYALSIMPEERRIEREVLLSYFFSVSVSDQCDSCPTCTGMCPTGALKRKKENDRKHLTFTSANCSGCGLCVDFCRKKALTLKNGFSHKYGETVCREMGEWYSYKLT